MKIVLSTTIAFGALLILCGNGTEDRVTVLRSLIPNNINATIIFHLYYKVRSVIIKINSSPNIPKYHQIIQLISQNLDNYHRPS